MTLSIAIMHAPWRSERVANVRVLLEQLPGALVVEDTAREGCWPTARRAWGVATTGHHLVVQDDAVLCNGFVRLVQQAIVERPVAAISFYASPWPGVGGVALCLPARWARNWLKWAEIAEYQHHDDELLARWLRHVGAEIQIAPLVDHAPFPSVVGNRPQRSPHFRPRPSALTWM